MIGLMDCNNFFVSCERLFRPDLLKRPVAVLSSNDGCIISRSQEVKDLGIPMGIPYFQVKDMVKKHDITLFSSNFPLYRDISSRVMGALRDEFDTAEVYSIDEAFFDVASDIDVEEVAQIRGRIIQKTGIPVSFGVGKTKTIAKVASTYSKKGTGVHIFTDDGWKSVQKDVSCGSIWGIGRQTTKKLTDAGIRTVADILACDPTYFRQTLGIVGERLYLELSGTSVFQVGDAHASEHQSIASTRSFHASVYDILVLQSALGHHTAHIGEKLRERGVMASTLTIIVAPSRFSEVASPKRVASIKLEVPTDDTRILLKEACTLLQTLFDPTVPYKKAGIMVSGIVPRDTVSGTLFSQGTEPAKDDRSVYAVADELNMRFGHGTLRPGVVLMTQKWQESKQMLSPAYTTSWNHIPRVKAV